MSTNRKKVAIVFVFLSNNLGDDLFVKQLCLRYPNVDFYASVPNEVNPVLSALENLHFTKEMNDFFKEYELPVVSSKCREYFAQFDGCLFLGGSIFMQHNQNWHGKLRNFSNRVGLNKKCYIVGANFGPYTDPNFLNKFGAMLSRATDVCFRDKQSVALFPDANNIRYAPDVLFGYKHRSVPTKAKVAISVIDPAWAYRPVNQLNRIRPHTTEYLEKITAICSVLKQRGYDITLLSFCQKQGDMRMANLIESRCLLNGITDINVLDYDGNADVILDELASSEAVIATRFHAMILGFVLGKPVYPIIYDAKQKNVLHDLHFDGMRTMLEDISSVDPEEVVDSLLDKNCGNGYNAIKGIIEKAIKESDMQFAGLDALLLESEA